MSDDDNGALFGYDREDDSAKWGQPAGRGKGRSRSPERRGGGRRAISRSRSRGRGSPERRGSGRRALSRSRSGGRPRGGDRGEGKGEGKGKSRPKTTGREMPKLFSIHKGTIASVQAYGAFVRLGDGSQYKDGLLHISRLSSTGRVEKVDDVVSTGDAVFVKVVEIKEEEGKYSLDMRQVGQKDGEDKDPNNVQIDAGGGKGKGGKADPIRIGAVQATTCSRCGARGHSARECFASSGKNYDLVEELPNGLPPEIPSAPDDPKEAKNAKVIKAALKAMIKSKKGGGSSSSSSSSSDSSAAGKAGKKAKKKEKKLLKKQLKKEKKEQKKKIKELKKQIKDAKKSKDNDKGNAGDQSDEEKRKDSKKDGKKSKRDKADHKG